MKKSEYKPKTIAMFLQQFAEDLLKVSRAEETVLDASH
jgi:hypothetical protein